MPSILVQRLIAVVLAVSLTVMGLAAAMARGQVLAGGQVVVLCSGGGLVQITLGADGAPTGDSHLCPDLAASLLAAYDLAVPEVARPDGLAEALEPAPARRLSHAPRAVSRARGPPAVA